MGHPANMMSLKSIKNSLSSLFRKIPRSLRCNSKSDDDKPENFVGSRPLPPKTLLRQGEPYRRMLDLRNDLVCFDKTPDTPLNCIYRIYEYMMFEYVTGYRNEIEYFWNHPEWPVCDVPDPKDPDPARYAFVSRVPVMLAAAFNNLIQMGLPRDAPRIIKPELAEQYRQRPESEKKYETVPDWVKQVPALKKTLVIPDWDGSALSSFEDKEASRRFREKNILSRDFHIMFI